MNKPVGADLPRVVKFASVSNRCAHFWRLMGCTETLMSYIVKVGFDAAERRYFVLYSEIPGLNIEADTFEAFVEAVQDAAPDLVAEPLEGSRIRFEREVVLAA